MDEPEVPGQQFARLLQEIAAHDFDLVGCQRPASEPYAAARVVALRDIRSRLYAWAPVAIAEPAGRAGGYLITRYRLVALM